MRKDILIVSTMLATACSLPLHAAGPVVTFSTSNLLPNTPNQTIQVLIQGSDLISGENLNFQIHDNGSGTSFANIDVITGTIFVNNYQAPTGPGLVTSGPNAGRVALISVTTDTDFVPENGLLATLQVNTTSASAGTFDLDMLNTINGASNVVLPNPSNTNNAIILLIQFPHNHLSIGNATRQWTVNGGGTWDTDSHWTPFAPYAMGDIANFLGALTSGTAIVTLDGVRTVGTLSFNDTAGSYSLAPGTGGLLQLNNGTASAVISSLSGAHSITAPIVLTSNTTATVAAGSLLTLSGGIGGSALSVNGSGKLVVAGTDNHPSAVNVAVGSNLQVGSGSVGGSLGTSTVTANGMITYVGSSPLVASPLGGGGTITFTGNNSPGHLITVDSVATVITPTGSLQVEAGGVLAGGNVTNNGVLAFARVDAVSHSSPISGSGTLSQVGTGTTTLTGVYSATGPVTLSAGKLAFGPTAAPRLGAGVVLKMQSATLSAGSVLDMTNHDLLIGNSSTATVNTEIKNGLGFGNASGPQITSSAADLINGNTFLVPISADAVLGNGGVGSAVGQSWDSVQITEPNTTIVKYTWFGDVNLDGAVNGDDLIAVLGNLNVTTPGLNDIGTAWIGGDVNLDNVVNGDDLIAVLGNLNHAGSPTGELDNIATGSVSTVPEPASLLVLGLGMLLATGSRRRPAESRK